jgi:HCO3- transporter family
VRRCWEQRFSIVPVALIFNNSVGWKIQSLEQILICVEVNQLTKQNSILPALAFSLDMFSKTHQSYGVNEVLLASVLGSVVFSMFAAQPLVIVGVTGKHLVRIAQSY